MTPTALRLPRTRNRGQEIGAPVGLIFTSISVHDVEITFLVSPNAGAIENSGRNNRFALIEGVIDLQLVRRPILRSANAITGGYLPVIAGG